MAFAMGTVGISLFFALCILQAHSYDRIYDLSLDCHKEPYAIIINTAGLLVLKQGEMQSSAQCDVHITSNWIAGPGHPIDDWLMVLIEDLNMPCEGPTRLQFFNGSTESNSIISYPPEICSDSPYQTWYLVRNKTMGIRLTAGDHRDVKLKLVVTATSYDKEQNSDDFVCTNKQRIVSSLKCDGDNNCGDFSDEVEDGCRYTKQSYRALGLGLGLGLVLPLFIIAVVGWICYKHQKTRVQDKQKLLQGRVNAGQQSNNPQYASIANASEPSTDDTTVMETYQTAPSSLANIGEE